MCQVSYRGLGRTNTFTHGDKFGRIVVYFPGAVPFSLMDYQASFWECSGGNIPPVAMVLGCHGESCVCVCVGKACASKVFYWFCPEGGILLGLPDVQFVIMGEYFTASQ